MNDRGFTTTELLVALSVFIVATTVTMGVFVRAVRVQRQASGLMALNSDSSLVLERMVREVRSGYDFTVVDSNGDGCNERMDFSRVRETATTTISYQLTGTELGRREGTGLLMPLNSSQTSVDKLCFIMTQPITDQDPWRITAIFHASSVDEQVPHEAFFQTTISARILPEELPTNNGTAD